MSGNSKSILAVLDREDQDNVKADLGVFFGPRAHIFLQLYDRMLSREGNKRLYVRSWSWIVMLTGFPWFFYRKMYGVGAALILIPFLIHYVIGGIGMVALAATFATSAKGGYVRAGLRRILKADELALTGDERQRYLARAGGVSLVAGTIAGVTVAAATLVVFVGHGLAHRPI